MKAIKLASVFAVSAVAVAVSTTTFAAEAVISGQAGLEYRLLGDTHADAAGAAANNNTWRSKGELNLNVDTGVVAALVEFRENVATIVKATVTQGAVSFGDFDGSISDDAYLKATRVIEGEYGDGSKTDLGVRYDLGSGLVVALEMKTGQDGVGFAADYSVDLGMASLDLSAGTYAGESSAKVKDEVSNYAIGVSVPVGPATFIASYAGGTTTTGTTDTDIGVTTVGVTFAVSDAFTLGIQNSTDLEAAAGTDDNNTEVAAFYTAGDITYYAAALSGDDLKEETRIGAKASF
ncbi:hypothetical protein MACH16_22900 [Marinomonas pontica]|uniref:Porin n=1 Tax=Marinomonas pontica TaxID=264739 RepID=A0ABM8FEP5_9GAMM|nr:hypothetical protein MACH16_22900 [Marinomonas pontica]